MHRNVPSEKDSVAYNRAMIPFRFLLYLFLCLASLSVASPADDLTRREWKVVGIVREALVYAPPSARTNATPVVFACHGHGGSMQTAGRSFSSPTSWPHATVVFLQGANTPATS